MGVRPEPPPDERNPSLARLESLLAGGGAAPPGPAPIIDLRFGAVYWIPEAAIGFSSKPGERPFVVVAPQLPGQPTVVVCPTTTLDTQGRGAEGIVIPANTLVKLPKESVILVHRHYPVHCRQFHYYRFIGLLPNPLIEALRAARCALGLDAARRGATR